MAEENEHSLEKIAERIGRLDAKMDSVIETGKENRGGTQKLMYAMLGIIAANVGVKFLGTPLHIWVAGYVLLFTTTFLLCSLIGFWKRLKTCRKVLIIAFTLIMMLNIIPRLISYKTGCDIMSWHPSTLNYIFSTVAVFVTYKVWRSVI